MGDASAVCYGKDCVGIHYLATVGKDLTFAWAHLASCNMCKRRGYLCIEGCVLRKAIDTRAQLKRHHYRKYSKWVDNDVDLLFPIADSKLDNEEPSRFQAIPPIVLKSQILQSFLDHSIVKGMLPTLRRFVSSACLGSITLDSNVIESVPILETFTVIVMARLVFRIGTVNQALLSLLMSVFVCSRPQISPSSLPITRSQIIRVITNASSRTSINSTIPTPRPTELALRHAYLGLA
jgi:hypothetical protein